MIENLIRDDLNSTFRLPQYDVIADLYISVAKRRMTLGLINHILGDTKDEVGNWLWARKLRRGGVEGVHRA